MRVFDGEGDLVTAGLTIWCRQYLDRKLEWDDIHPDARNALAELFLGLVQTYEDEHKADSDLIRAVRAVEMLLAMPGRIEGKDENERTIKARREVRNAFAIIGVQISSAQLGKRHSEMRRGLNKTPTKRGHRKTMQK